MNISNYIRTIFLFITIGFLCITPCNAMLYFALTLESNRIPNLQIQQNWSKILIALYESNGEEWFVNNILKNRYEGRVGFGANNLIVLKSNTFNRNNYDESEMFLLDFKKAFDLMSNNNDTIYVSGANLGINTNLFKEDKSYRQQCLSEFYEKADSAFNSTNSVVTVEFSNSDSPDSSILVELEELLKFVKIRGQSFQTEYDEACKTLNLQNLQSCSAPNNRDYALYMDYLIKSNRAYLKNNDNTGYTILPFCYDSDSCGNYVKDTTVKEILNKSLGNHETIDHCTLVVIIVVALIVILCISKVTFDYLKRRNGKG